MPILKTNRRKPEQWDEGHVTTNGEVKRHKRTRTSLKRFYASVWELCGGRCEACGGVLDEMPHHIIYKSQQGKDVPENGLGLCRMCHFAAHHGKVVTVPREDGHGNTTERLSGRQWILRILDGKVNEKGYRWAEVHEHLRRTAK